MDLNVEGLSSWYGQAQVLWNIDMVAREGEVIGILGRNGAGKTTLLRAIAGLHSKSSGAVKLGGQDMVRRTTHDIARAGVAFLREAGQLPKSLSVTQNLLLGQRLARSRGKSPRTLEEIWEWFPLLQPLADRKTELLSGGQRQALALAMAFASRPSLMLLDEPSAGLAPLIARDLYTAIRNLAADGLTVVVVEQHPAWLTGLVNRCYLLETGRVTDEGSLDALLGRKQSELL